MKKGKLSNKKYYILLTFILITTALLTGVNIYCYLIKYQAKQKHLLPYHTTNNILYEWYEWVSYKYGE